MMTRFWIHTLGAIVAVVALGASASPTQAAFITTVPSWNGTGSVSAFGQPNTATYGQTITVGATDTFLTDFSFRMRTDAGQISNFEAVVMKWDSVTFRAVGPILSSSALTNTGPGNGFNTVTVSTNVNLAPNSQYVLFFSASNVFDTNSDRSVFGFTDPAAYAGGEFVFRNNGNDPSLLTSSRWENFVAGDLAFTANLGGDVNPTPAPAGIVLFGLGFAGMGMLRSFRKGKTVVA